MAFPKIPSIEPGEPKKLAQTIITSMPVVLTVLATILAGISSSEMTRAQYYRSLAAQEQSKAGDQWSLFQAKRIRSSVLQGTADTLEATSDIGPVTTAQLAAMAGRLEKVLGAGAERNPLATAPSVVAASTPATLSSASASMPADETRTARAFVMDAAGGARKLAAQIRLAAADAPVVAAVDTSDAAMPAVDAAEVGDANVKNAIGGVRAHKTEVEMAATMQKIDEPAIVEALNAAQRNADDFDKATKPTASAWDRIHGLMASVTGLAREYRQRMGAVDRPDAPSQAAEVSACAAECERLFRNLSAARARYNIARYNRESGYNQAIAELLEVQVRKSGASSDRHRSRSSYFFMGMLLAQAGVTIATVSLSLRNKSILLGLAGAAGFIALSLGAYIYLAI